MPRDADAPGHAAGLPPAGRRWRGAVSLPVHRGSVQSRRPAAQREWGTGAQRESGRSRPTRWATEPTGWPSADGRSARSQPEQLSFTHPSQPSPPHQHEPSGLTGIPRPDQQSRTADHSRATRAARAAGPHRRAQSGQQQRAAAPPCLRPPQLEVHVRDVRHRQQQPVRARGRRRGRRGPRQGLQPAVHLRRLGPGQDAPAARDRPLRADALQRHQGALRELGGVHQRLHQHDPRRQAGRVPPQVPRCRRAPGGRHPVPGEQGRNPGGVFPHLQHPAQREQADRHLLRPGAQAPGHPGGPAAQPVRVGPADRRAAARARDPDRDPVARRRSRRA